MARGDRERLLRKGLLSELGKEPGQACHGIHQRLSECLPFFAEARKDASETLRELLGSLEDLLRGHDSIDPDRNDP